MIPTETEKLIGLVMACMLIGLLLLISLWDAYCLIYADRTDWTVSFYLSGWVKQFPLLLLALGIVIGHIVWPFSMPTHKP